MQIFNRINCNVRDMFRQGRVLCRLPYLVAGAISGALWSAIALILDSGWAIPTNSALILFGALCSGVATGVSISLVFRWLFNRTPTLVFLALPLATLPVAITIFAVLLWVARRFAGVHFEPQVPPSHELRLILETYLTGGLVSIVSPILLGVALLNQCVMRFLLRHAAPRKAARKGVAH